MDATFLLILAFVVAIGIQLYELTRPKCPHAPDPCPECRQARDNEDAYRDRIAHARWHEVNGPMTGPRCGPDCRKERG